MFTIFEKQLSDELFWSKSLELKTANKNSKILVKCIKKSFENLFDGIWKITVFDAINESLQLRL